MTYCNEGDKPKVEYKFKDGSKKIYESPYSPIEVTTGQKPKDGTDNFNGEGFELSFYSPGNNRIVSVLAKDYRILDKGYPSMNIIACGETNFGAYDVRCDPATIEINPNIKCPPPLPEPDCLLKVKYQGSTIFQDSGKCPVTFNVICGRCPDGHIECKTNKYPGYCCISCQGTASKIRGIAAKVGRCNCG